MREVNGMYGKIIRFYRKARGLTQTQLADMISVSDKTVSSWEVDRTEPDMHPRLECPSQNCERPLGLPVESEPQGSVLVQHAAVRVLGLRAVEAVLGV